MFTHYENINGDKKMPKLGCFGGWGVTQGHRAHMTSYSTLTETMHLSYTVIVIVIASYSALSIQSKDIAIFQFSKWPPPPSFIFKITNFFD